jgi:TonB family protein
LFRNNEKTTLTKLMPPLIFLALVFFNGLALWIGSFKISFSSGQEKQQIDPSWPCHDDFPVAKDANDKPLLLNTKEAAKRAIHCEKPFMPELARRARLQGSVIILIAVAPDGKVRCLKVISGHPLCTQSAIDAARLWTFHPMKDGTSDVGFLAQLEFQFSTGDMSKLPGPDCTKARWK